MRTLIVLCALASLAIGSALGQSSGSSEVWKEDPASQRERDAARKAILEDELAAEAKQYTEAHGELREGQARQASSQRLEDASERVSRHRRNMAELAREIARAEGDIPGKASRPKPASDDWLIRVQPAKTESPEWLVPADRKR
jgi:outer membrane PBP1 activator LpoA protein